MIDALIGGKIYGKAVQRSGSKGKPFVTCKVRAATGDGDGVFVNVIAFPEHVCTALLGLEDGDSVALSGELTPKVWIPDNGEPRPVLSLVAHAAITSYHVSRKRDQMAGPDL